MIVGDSKPLEEILAMIEGREKVLVLGCRGCVTVCNVGGEKEVGILASTLRIARKKNGQAPGIEEMTLERQCDPEYIEELAEVAENYDAIISIACGVGPQFVSERFPGARVFPGINTTFIGGALEHGVWTERCQSCGNCLVHNFGGLCPIARCSKSLMNGPCGGSASGNCEISPDVPCVWDQIVKKMDAMGRLDELEQVWPNKNWLTARDGGPRQRVREDLKQ
ncbi:MAG: methylenetetrahydrofolate reductase C-terminal domain-containing protein [Desulfarculaceae bacterium]|nr:methylenetetrahydrofolate reductase C-terminal domain-containing protein [Desulfarculaceae bacterium]MCF8071228.1 methylenetetrahydrofolate reductase C-terminal domain-containing protein [Desulfarculaceae bacterium]MCF8101169.1 methylenetetrahydrofolate reductase C-terminal domain-containing protein [Desulfarculaceae bacterium]MCF8115282.1 methylenetetrahydrofolate reductase C-terminal domain-containing protein [Desulfarculaceae bacterium]